MEDWLAEAYFLHTAAVLLVSGLGTTEATAGIVHVVVAATGA